MKQIARQHQKINEGEVPQYFVQGSHPAIIEQDVFDLVQYELARRAASGQNATSVHPFSSKVFCTCGGMFGSKVWNSTQPYRRTVWQCNAKYAKKQPCRTPHLIEAQVEAAFLAAFNQRIIRRDEAFAAHEEMLAVLTNTTDLDSEATALTQECEVVMELTRRAVQENASTALDQEAYQQRHDALVERYNTAHARLGEIEATRTERRAKLANIKRFLRSLERQTDLVTDFDDELWYTTVDRMTVHADGQLCFLFRDGVEVVPQAGEIKMAA